MRAMLLIFLSACGGLSDTSGDAPAVVGLEWSVAPCQSTNRAYFEAREHAYPLTIVCWYTGEDEMCMEPTSWTITGGKLSVACYDESRVKVAWLE